MRWAQELWQQGLLRLLTRQVTVRGASSAPMLRMAPARDSRQRRRLRPPAQGQIEVPLPTLLSIRTA
ncbi:MAG: hypothetical protein NVS2B15_15430 [Pseudarthrobacter sp.]